MIELSFLSTRVQYYWVSLLEVDCPVATPYRVRRIHSYSDSKVQMATRPTRTGQRTRKIRRRTMLSITNGISTLMITTIRTQGTRSGITTQISTGIPPTGTIIIFRRSHPRQVQRRGRMI